MAFRILFMGTPAFAVPSLEALAAAGHTIAAVVTQPDRPRGRGQKVQPSEVKAAALSLGAAVLQPTKLRDPQFAADLQALTPDLGVVAAYGRILPANVLKIPRHGMINVHASLLPRWRGAAPVHRALLAGDSMTGVTIMRVVEQLDAGPMLATASTAIDPDETSEALERRLADLGADLLVAAIDALARGALNEEPQQEADATYASRLERRESALDWNQPAATIHNRIRGLQPWPLVSTILKDKRIVLRSSRAVPDEDHQSAPGTILKANADGLLVAASSGAVRLIEVQPEGKAAMPVAAFLNGHRVRAGDRFVSVPALP